MKKLYLYAGCLCVFYSGFSLAMSKEKKVSSAKKENKVLHQPNAACKKAFADALLHKKNCPRVRIKPGFATIGNLCLSQLVLLENSSDLIEYY